MFDLFTLLISFFSFFFFFFNDTATTEIYTLSLHDALPIYHRGCDRRAHGVVAIPDLDARSEEHTSELQSRLHLVCRLLLEKKKKQKNQNNTTNKTHKTKNNTTST